MRASRLTWLAWSFACLVVAVACAGSGAAESDSRRAPPGIDSGAALLSWRSADLAPDARCRCEDPVVVGVIDTGYSPPPTE
jgi:hypothetical protein